MRQGHVLSPVLAALSLAIGCGGQGQPSDPGGNVVLGDGNNYRTMATLSIPTVETAAATDLDICWDAAVNDIQCHPLSPVADLDNVSLLRISHLSEPQVAAELASGQLTESSVAGYVDYHTDHSATCAKLSQLSFFGTAINLQEQYVESVSYTYLLLFSKGTKPGIGARVMTFIKPTAASINTHVDAPSGCGLLDFSADLASLTKVPVSIAGPWVVDWHGVTRDGQGNPIPFGKIDGVTIGFYEGKTVADLQAGILDIELIATTLWDVKLKGGRTADLAQATDRATGAPFSGFSSAATGTWMLALTCSTCQSPAPPLLTILDPSAGGA